MIVWCSRDSATRVLTTRIDSMRALDAGIDLIDTMDLSQLYWIDSDSLTLQCRKNGERTYTGVKANLRWQSIYDRDSAKKVTVQVWHLMDRYNDTYICALDGRLLLSTIEGVEQELNNTLTAVTKSIHVSNGSFEVDVSYGSISNIVAYDVLGQQWPCSQITEISDTKTLVRGLQQFPAGFYNFLIRCKDGTVVFHTAVF